jgi:MFS transporter, PPP family, 3-phenylpropionic acid transporter
VQSVRQDRDVRALFVLGGASGAAFLPFFALLLRERGLSPEQIGLVLAVSSLASVAASPAWSHVADTRLGSVGALRITSVASALVALALIPAGSRLWVIVSVVVVLGLVGGPGAALADALALAHLGPERITEYGSIRLWASIGWAVAVFGFGLWFQRAGLEPLLPAYAIGLLVYAAFTSRFPATKPERGDEGGSRLGSVGDAFRSVPGLRSFLFGLLLVSVATWGAQSFVPLRIASRGGGPFLVGLAACVAAVIEIPFFRASGWLGQHVGLRVLYATGCGIYVLMMIGWALVANPTVVALIKMGGGAGFGLMYAALVVATGRLMPGKLQNTGQALMQMSTMGIGPILGSAVGGVVFQRLGAPALFAGAAALVAVGAGVVWRALAEERFARRG